MQVVLFHGLLQRNAKKAFTVSAEGIYVYIEGSIYTSVQKKCQRIKTISLSSNTISDHVNDLARDTYSVSLNKNIKYNIVVPLGNSSDLSYILLEEKLQNV
jgi:hypothetical protein